MLTILSRFLPVLGLLFALPASAQQGSNNMWIMWEQVPPLATGQPSSFRSHLMFQLPRREAEHLFFNLMPPASRYGAANVVHDRSPICVAAEESTPPAQPGTIDDIGRELAAQIDTLRGLPGVFADLRGIRGPAGYQRNYGEDSQAYMLNAFAKAGIKLLTREEVDATPGHPTLTMRFSPEVIGCKPWSVSLSLKQHVVLTRDTTIMIETTTWSGSARQNEENVEYDAYDAVVDALEKFVNDFQKANSPEIIEAAASN